MKTFLASVLASLLLAQPAIAFERMTKGQAVPEDGYFFTLQEEAVMRYRLMDADYYQKKSELQSDLIKDLETKLVLQEKLVDTYKTAFYTENDRLTKVLQGQVKTKWGYYLLGVITVIGGGMALGLSAKALK